VVAELVAGTGGIGSGLAFRILEAGYRLNIARMFAALILIAAMGVVIFAALSVSVPPAAQEVARKRRQAGALMDFRTIPPEGP
jgi:ABC-type nitrate/sulfonate/bicarbonate transport system permease component